MDAHEHDTLPIPRPISTPLEMRAPRRCPERALMAAVLEQALNDLRIEGGSIARCRRRRAIVSARAWLEGRGGAWPFSFENVCEQLGIDPTAVRRAAGVACAPP